MPFAIPSNPDKSPIVPAELEAYFHDFNTAAGLSTILIPARVVAPAGYYGVSEFIVPDDCDIVMQGVRCSAMRQGEVVSEGVRFRLIDKQNGREFYGNNLSNLGQPISLFSPGYKRTGYHLRETNSLNHWQMRRSVIQFRFDNENDFPVLCKAVVDCLAMYRGSEGVENE